MNDRPLALVLAEQIRALLEESGASRVEQLVALEIANNLTCYTRHPATLGDRLEADAALTPSR